MKTLVENFLKNLPQHNEVEMIENLIESNNVRIERIVSNAQLSPDGFWYDQNENEWVILLAGSACIRFDDNSEIILNPFDYLLIPTHRKHRVEWTSKDEVTVWLAVFYN